MLITRTHTFGAKLFRAESIILADELIICGWALAATPDTAIKDNK